MRGWRPQLIAGALALAAVTAPRWSRADDLGMIGGLGILYLGGAIIIAATLVFVVLAVVLGRMRRSPRGLARWGPLVIGVRVLAALWYAATLVPIGMSLRGHDTGSIVLLCVVGGAPAHIAAFVALWKTRVLPRASPTG
jgi:hypothetical protein